VEIAHPGVSGAKVIAGSVVTSDDDAAEAIRENADVPEGSVTSEAAEDPEAVPPEAEGEGTGYDETSGIVYERQHRGFEILLPGSGPPDDTQPGGTPADEAAAPADLPTGEPAVAEPAAAEPAARQSAGIAGPVWNQTMATPPEPAEGDGESGHGAFGKLFGRKGDGAEDGSGDLPPLTRVRDLPFDHKMRIWRLRAMIVIIVGVVFSVIANWEIGITLAVIAGIADTIYRSRTVESHAWTQPGMVDRATWRAQRRTVKQLAAMERAGYVALHRRPIPNSTEVIDHLVVGPTGVYAIDSEKWVKDLPIRTSNQKQLWLGPESKKERLQHAHWEAGQASERLSAKLGMKITVQPALAVYGPKIPWDVLNVRGVDVFSGDRLRTYLRRRARRKSQLPLTSQQIRRVYEAAAEVLPLEWQNTVTPVG
jgi:hypothetical protein